jgi:hypothetical protein
MDGGGDLVQRPEEGRARVGSDQPEHHADRYEHARARDRRAQAGAAHDRDGGILDVWLVVGARSGARRHSRRVDPGQRRGRALLIGPRGLGRIGCLRSLGLRRSIGCREDGTLNIGCLDASAVEPGCLALRRLRRDLHGCRRHLDGLSRGPTRGVGRSRAGVGRSGEIGVGGREGHSFTVPNPRADLRRCVTGGRGCRCAGMLDSTTTGVRRAGLRGSESRFDRRT